MIGAPQDALLLAPGRLAAALREALDTGPHGLRDRIAVFPGGG